jgi:hypothetical protein
MGSEFKSEIVFGIAKYIQISVHAKVTDIWTSPACTVGIRQPSHGKQAIRYRE